MRIYVRLAEPFWRVVGQRDLDLELEPNSQVADLLALLLSCYPALEKELSAAPPYIFVGEEEVDHQTPLTDGDKVHLIWPVAGG